MMSNLMILELTPIVRGRYELNINRPDGKCESYSSCNTILDNFFDYFTTQTTGWVLGGDVYPHFGANSLATTPEMTGLVSPITPSTSRVAGVRVDTVEEDLVNNVLNSITKITMICEKGQFQGFISEVGIGLSPSVSDNVIYSRSLSSDDPNLPSTPNAGADDVIELIYFFTCEIPLTLSFNRTLLTNGVGSDVEIGFSIGLYDNVNNNILEACSPFFSGIQYLRSYDSTVNEGDPNIAPPSNTNVIPISLTSSVSGSGRLYSFVLGGDDSNEDGGVGMIALSNYPSTDSSLCHFKISFNPPIQKDTSKYFEVGFISLPVRAD